jgi:hypothetical protein
VLGVVVRGVKLGDGESGSSWETHFGLTAPTTIPGISTCSRPEETGRSGGNGSMESCRDDDQHQRPDDHDPEKGAAMIRGTARQRWLVGEKTGGVEASDLHYAR